LVNKCLQNDKNDTKPKNIQGVILKLKFDLFNVIEFARSSLKDNQNRFMTENKYAKMVEEFTSYYP